VESIIVLHSISLYIEILIKIKGKKCGNTFLFFVYNNWSKLHFVVIFAKTVNTETKEVKINLMFRKKSLESTRTNKVRFRQNMRAVHEI
jgi:hypothetical protein